MPIVTALLKKNEIEWLNKIKFILFNDQKGIFFEKILYLCNVFFMVLDY